MRVAFRRSTKRSGWGEVAPLGNQRTQGAGYAGCSRVPLEFVGVPCSLLPHRNPARACQPATAQSLVGSGYARTRCSHSVGPVPQHAPRWSSCGAAQPVPVVPASWPTQRLVRGFPPAFRPQPRCRHRDRRRRYRQLMNYFIAQMTVRRCSLSSRLPNQDGHVCRCALRVPSHPALSPPPARTHRALSHRAGSSSDLA